MLIKCPECEKDVSDKAVCCPNCGCPVKNMIAKKPKRRHMRLPNGFGQISEVRGRNLRKPFRVMITIGKTDTGKPISKPLRPQAYFETYNQAYEALIEHHQNPYDMAKDMTVKEVYEKWIDEYMHDKNDSYERLVRSTWRYCSEIYNMKFSDVRARHIKGIMENGSIEYKGEIRKASADVKKRIKSLFNLLGDYGLEYELTDRNYARTFDINSNIIKESEQARRAHFPYSEDEINKLWDNLDMPYVNILLVQCYSGWRPQELGLIRLENVDLENWTFSGGMKTEAGKNRIVPIHKKIREIVKSAYDQAMELNSEYLFNCPESRNGMFLSYDKYNKRFIKIRKSLGLNPEHRSHDGRSHFVTLAKKYNVDEYAIKYMVGHAINDITEKIYTTRELSWLQTEMEKIK